MSDFHLYNLLLMGNARHYDLWSEPSRAQSNKDIVNFFMNLNGRLKPDVTYEIGAYYARYSLDIKKALPQVHVIAFEANPYNYELYANNAEVKRSGIEYLHFAIADRTGETEFFVQRKVAGEAVNVVRGNNSLLMRAEEHVEYESVKVPAITLKDFAAKNNLLDKNFTAWIDVEGAAKSVLTGGDDLWANCSALLIEVEQHAYWKDQWLFQDVAHFLMERGFIPVARDFEYEYQFNVVFIKQDKLKLPNICDGLSKYHSLLGKSR